jgi:hypothetical protein
MSPFFIGVYKKNGVQYCQGIGYYKDEYKYFYDAIPIAKKCKIYYECLCKKNKKDLKAGKYHKNATYSALLIDQLWLSSIKFDKDKTFSMALWNSIATSGNYFGPPGKGEYRFEGNKLSVTRHWFGGPDTTDVFTVLKGGKYLKFEGRFSLKGAKLMRGDDDLWKRKSSSRMKKERRRMIGIAKTFK